MQAGRIEVIVGPMFAGKTTEMLRRINRAEHGHRRVVVMKYDKDQRYSVNKVSTHDEYMHDAIPCNMLLPHLEECLGYEVIGVDEGQFFPDVVEFSEKLANFGRTVIVAALDGTFQRKPFGKVLDLMSKCESITKLSAVCSQTGSEAAFSKRIVNSTDVELIGGSESYVAASRAAFFGIQTSGMINLTVGPIKSGKTTELLRVLNRYLIAGRKAICLRPESAHDFHKSNVEIKFIQNLPSIEELNQYDIIGIDEAQNFENIADWADELANSGKVVMVSAVDGNENHVAYPSIVELFPRCEKVTKLDSICPLTGLPAPFTAVVDGLKFIPISRLGILYRASMGHVLNSTSTN
ncbi:thymidine kinase family protein [Trichomonas vaginalis G3]|uniref:thymidine kinase n=1 Tax=Trichomonas vaginalis (strain ATCC PRA-98 / G3) TaxID=412133 RepID=A2EEN4_TRIV3|nr:thymidine kinase protein [Trichomonas vaginalis G3]EAY08840.1 thymidine kinase family protein [Trichomonas vaginalis G3]KAI5489335.1 thymidine kinase protein [Trichomonas vaginalis G3]|eukprot:XP_001321063.1 thymidine kinase family protein [Trichomonas vaginalis G3]